MASNNLDSDDPMAPAALAIGQSSEHASVQLAEFDEGFSLGSRVDAEVT